MKIYTVLDTKAEAYLPPVYFRADGEAIRNIIESAQGGKSLLGQHPFDYNLFRIGEFDEQTGKLTPVEGKIDLGCVGDLINLSMDEEERRMALVKTEKETSLGEMFTTGARIERTAEYVAEELNNKEQ